MIKTKGTEKSPKNEKQRYVKPDANFPLILVFLYGASQAQ